LQSTSEKQKKARWPFGHRADCPFRTFPRSMPHRRHLVSSGGFLPVQRIGPPPWIFRLVKPIAGPDEVVGGGEIVSSIGYDATPALATCSPFRRPQQAQLQGVAAVTSDHANATEIARVVGARRRDHPGESDRNPVMKRKPPMSLVEFGNGRSSKKKSSCGGRRAYRQFRRRCHRLHVSGTSTQPFTSGPLPRGNA
jgi:hypothetical protein